jgi:hypothetical protein
MTMIYTEKRFEIPAATRAEGMKPLVDTLSKMLFTDYFEEVSPDQDEQTDPETGDQGAQDERGARD